MCFCHCTNRECGVGIEEVDENHPHTLWWETHILGVEDVCWRPVAISITPGFINDGMGGHYEDTTENRLLAKEEAVRKMIEYQSSQKATIEKRLKERNFEEDNGGRGWTEEACLRALKFQEDRVERIKKSDTFYPAYQSVEIVVDEVPPDTILADFRKRVYEFADQNGIEILGIRIIE